MAKYATPIFTTALQPFVHNDMMRIQPALLIQPKTAQQGVVLLEALVAVLLFSMGVLALVGLQASMIKNTEDSKFRSEASYIAQQRIGMIWADPPNSASYAETNTDISTQLPNGTRTVAVSGVQVTVIVDWRQPGQAAHRFTAAANVVGN
jgi:type IV pilus assembly protein PilV